MGLDTTEGEEGIQCNFAGVHVYLFAHAHTKEAHDKLLKEFVACQNLGVKVEMQELGNDPASGKIGTAIQFANAAKFHPLLYINGLADAIVKKGGKSYEETRVMKCEGIKVTTEEAFQVTANALVITTNSPINHDLSAQWWDTADTYHYMRIEQRQDFDVLVVGGEDTSTGMKPRDFHDPYGNLAKWAKARWTSAEEVFEPADAFHIIGPEPLEAGKADQYVVTGDSGQGMTESTVAGIMIKDMILGKQNSWVKAYIPQRKLPLSKQTLSNVAEEIQHTVEFYFSGCVVQEGLTKIAVYKDGDGNLHKFSAICSHMKCVVKWNPLDATFDCPWDGSISDHLGHCINGPAKADLPPH
ncbi:unnamed protein product [Sphagnum troendelagicum]|uniref:Rieske domain-containing protein n=1 Tax=Sphagnum troendelagicum TaxID=128251 RepID=A0ABP0V1G9_9BRYO